MCKVVSKQPLFLLQVHHLGPKNEQMWYHVSGIGSKNPPSTKFTGSNTINGLWSFIKVGKQPTI
jgi:hypothetical protein